MPKKGVSFTTEDLRTPERLENVLRQFERALDRPVRQVLPTADLAALAKLLAPEMREQLQATGSFPINLQSLLPATGAGLVLQDTHIQRLSIYPPTNYPVGTLFWETDRTVLYLVSTVAGALVWKYIGGMHDGDLVDLPLDLGANDVGFLYDVNDYTHVLQWTGSIWTWGPYDLGSGYYGWYEDPPNTTGASAWQICNGATVARMNPDGTTTPVTVPNVATPRYMKAGLTSLPVAGYSGHTPTGTLDAIEFTGDPAPGVAVQSGAGTTVVSHPYTPDGFVSTPGFTGNPMSTLELPNKQARLYYRR